VVGDDDQTLYQFRGTDLSNILEFHNRYPDVHTVTIAENFRSSEGVVDVARQIIVRNLRRLPKQMEAGKTQEFVRGDILCQTFQDPEGEADAIAAQVGNMLGLPWRDEPKAAPRGLAYSDFAVLFRSVKNNAGPVLEALKRAHIPAVIVGYNNLFDRPEITACVSLFGFMTGDVDEPTLKQAWNAAGVGFTDENWSAHFTLCNAPSSIS
jgi:DNA helicase-2/ATP-dependent DNA helicase PcrA